MLKKILLLIGLVLVLKICIIDIFIPYQKIKSNVEDFAETYSNQGMEMKFKDLPTNVQTCLIDQKDKTFSFKGFKHLLRVIVYDYVGHNEIITGLDRKSALIYLMYDRYDNIEVQKDKKGRRFRKTTLLPIIEPNVDDIYIIGQVGDRLDNLAFKYYQDSSLWWIIARANNIGNGSLTVPIGIQLRIPQNQFEIIDEYKELNGIE